MTAPLDYPQNRINDNITFLDQLSHNLVKAIDDEKIHKIEKTICKMLDHNISILYIYTFYNYAYSKHKINSAEYIKQILLTDNNIFCVSKHRI